MKNIGFLLLFIPFIGFGQNDSLTLENKLSGKIGIEVQPSIKSNEPLYVVDGKIVDKTIVEAIDPKDIDSINILKDKTAVEKYGEQGKNGVVEIKMKKREVSVLDKLENSIPRIGINSNKAPEIIPIDSLQILPKNKFPGTVCQGSIRNNSMPIIVVDGKIISSEQASKIDPNNIESIRVEKTGKYGTIVVETKEGLIDYDLAVLDLGYESFLAMQPSASSYSLNYLTNKNSHYVSVWNSRVINGNPDIYDMPIDYDSRTYYGLEFEYKLFMFFKFMEDKHQISMM